MKQNRACKSQNAFLAGRLLAAVLAAALVLSACGGTTDTKTSVQTSVPVQTSSQAAKAAATPTAKPAASQSAVQPKAVDAGSHPAVDMSGSAMVGNSCVDDLNTLGVLPEMDCFARTGLTVQTVFTRSTASGSVPVLQELGSKQYKRVFLEFGENELGWQRTDIFCDDYAKVIDAVRKAEPNAKVYVQALTPVSAAVDQANRDNTNNKRVREYNALLQQLAKKKGVTFLNIDAVLVDKTGALPAEASEDGIHFNKKYSQIWVDYLKTHC